MQMYEFGSSGHSYLTCTLKHVKENRMTEMKTPGVYIEERSAFPNSVVEVATAIPAFIGHTKKALFQDKSLHNKPFKLTSLEEYLEFYGATPETTYNLSVSNNSSSFDIGGIGYQLSPQEQNYSLHNSIRLFFENGGANCYIVSVGSYQDDFKLNRMLNGLGSVVNEP